MWLPVRLALCSSSSTWCPENHHGGPTGEFTVNRDFSFPDCKNAFQYHGQRLSLAAGNSISDFDGNDACLSPQLCQLLNCAEHEADISRVHSRSRFRRYRSVWNFLRRLEMTCPLLCSLNKQSWLLQWIMGRSRTSKVYLIWDTSLALKSWCCNSGQVSMLLSSC